MMNILTFLLSSFLTKTILFLALSSTNVVCVAQKQKDYDEFVLRPALQNRPSLVITSKDNRDVLNGTTFRICLGVVQSFTCKASARQMPIVKWEFKYSDSEGNRQQWQDAEPVHHIDRYTLRLYDVQEFGHYRCTVYSGNHKAFITFRVEDWSNPRDHCYELFNKCQKEKLCQNGGTCIDVLGSYICKCAGNYDGRHCEIGHELKGKYEVAILHRSSSAQDSQTLRNNMPTRISVELHPYDTETSFKKELTFPKDNNLFNWVSKDSNAPLKPFLTFEITPKITGLFEVDVQFVGNSYSRQTGFFFSMTAMDVNEVPFRVFGNTTIRMRMIRKCDPGHKGTMCMNNYNNY